MEFNPYFNYLDTLILTNYGFKSKYLIIYKPKQNNKSTFLIIANFDKFNEIPCLFILYNKSTVTMK